MRGWGIEFDEYKLSHSLIFCIICKSTYNSIFFNQLVQPAYQFMLGHIRTGTLEKFKEAFNNALNEGKGFAAAARDCTKQSMSQFDEESEGMVTNI